MREPRQLNVQQQNARTLRALRATADYWRAHPLPEALHLAAQDRGVDLATSIILRFDIDFPGMPSLVGILLTQAERFIEFEIDVVDAHHEVLEWSDVTARQNLNEHNRGTGVGYGALAISLLRSFNAKPTPKGPER